MKHVVIAAFLVMVPPPQAPVPVAHAAAATGVIEGRGTHAGTMDPIPNVHVTLIKPNPSGNNSTPETAAAADYVVKFADIEFVADPANDQQNS